MGSNDRRRGDLQHVKERFIRYMGNVDDHAQPVHLPDYLLPKFAESVHLRVIRIG